MEQTPQLPETPDKYKYFMRPEPKDDLGPIELVQDDFTGRTLRKRSAKIGMIRNATEKKDVEVWLDPIPHLRIDKAKELQGWYQPKVTKPGVRARPCFSEAILTEPYGGYCTVGCAFCYINSGFRGYRGSGLITVPLNYGDQIKSQLAKMKTSAAGYFSSFTDPFTDLEALYHNTELGAQAFVDLGLPVFFLSRLAYPEWAFDMLRKNSYSYAQKSINTPDEDDWKKLSPGAISLERHFSEIRDLSAQGTYVSIQVNPVIAGITSHEEIEELIAQLAFNGADHVIVKFVEAGYSWAPAMVERMKQRFGDNRAALFEELFVDNIANQRTVTEEYRLEGHRRYQAQATRCGITYATCYEYAYERNSDGVTLNKTGRSVGGDFLTADQCHGQRVPLFTRASLDQPFSEVKDCPPQGCLTCGDKTGGVGACGSTLFGAANALRMKDYKTGVKE